MEEQSVDPNPSDYETIHKVCRIAVKNFYKGRKRTPEQFKDSLQDALCIAYGPRGLKEIRTSKELYYKVLYGLIDIYRSRTHCRWFISKGIQQPRFINTSRIDNERKNWRLEPLYDNGYRQWIAEQRGPLFWYETEDDINQSGTTRRRYVPKIGLDEAIEKSMSCFSSRKRSWINMYIEGKAIKDIAQQSNKGETTVRDTLRDFRNRLKAEILRMSPKEDARLD